MGPFWKCVYVSACVLARTLITCSWFTDVLDYCSKLLSVSWESQVLMPCSIYCVQLITFSLKNIGWIRFCVIPERSEKKVTPKIISCFMVQMGNLGWGSLDGVGKAYLSSEHPWLVNTVVSIFRREVCLEIDFRYLVLFGCHGPEYL